MSSAENSGVWMVDVHDLVWVKMKAFPWWPGKVVESPKHMGKSENTNSKCVFLFGSFSGKNKYKWIEVDCIKPYNEFKAEYFDICSYLPFRAACKAIERYIQNQRTNEMKKNAISDKYEKRFDNLVQRVNKPDLPSLKRKVSMEHSSTLNTSIEKDKSQSTADQNTEVKPKKKKSRCSRKNFDILTNVGLVDVRSNCLQKNNALLDGPKVRLLNITLIENINETSNVLKTNKVVPSKLTFGFIGLGTIGSEIVKNLLKSGYKVHIWNRTTEKIKQFKQTKKAIPLAKPSDVLICSDITFCCVTDPEVANEMVFGRFGVLSDVTHGKAFVEMSGIDANTSQDIANAIIEKGGRYLETMIQGSKPEAEQGNLVCISAGDKTVFDDCESVFSTISKTSFYLSETVGTASKISLILHTIKAISLVGLAEGMYIADRAGLSQKDMLEILSLTSLNCPWMMENGNAMINNQSTTNHHALKLLQKDVRLALQLSDTVEQPCPIAATVNDQLIFSKFLGHGDHDTSSVYDPAKYLAHTFATDQ